MDVKIAEVDTEMVVTEGVGPLGPDEVKKLVALVLDQFRKEQDLVEQRKCDVKIKKRAFLPDSEV